jgi:hypothetical protein
MHLRHLIVLIIDARDAGTRSCNRGLGLGLERNFAMPHGTAFLIGQIKLTRIHVLLLFLPGVRVKRAVKHLYTMSKDPAALGPEGPKLPNLLSVCDVVLISRCWWSQTGSNRRPHACKARALPTELWPQSPSRRWWARVDSNYRPHAYQACALTT